ncbi:hypothetical protein BAE44_0004944 [Dichanthelium oligosanthes]|uniref:DUF1618 domain-containing protein n=1 Tax=Dichanthelium oligosanthes TaxID=888268 RepID=A0A1E5W9X3_9POAL|nr:hypothetical protein BAE44_0004944 [Dichanthelium oligosanthes]
MPTSSDYVLLNAHACISSVSCNNATTARATTRKHQTIEVSLLPARPPLPSDLLVHCPDLDPSAFTVPPSILRAVEKLLLLRVAIGCPPDYISPKDCDYFIYRLDATCGPSLERILCPHPFHDDDVGLLCRGDHYIIAVLEGTPTLDVYDLHLFHSETPETWSSRQVSVEEPQREFPLKVSRNCYRLFNHDTSTVITIGGEGGTMGWVDLWRGILLCDVLREQPTLRGLPLPMPVDLMSGNNGNGFELGCPKSLRGISFINKDKSGQPCLKLVHLQADATQLPYEEHDGLRSFLMHDWAITTWNNVRNTKMTSSWEDWHEGQRIQASCITVDNQLTAELLDSGLFLDNKPQDGDGPGRALQNLMVSDPAPAIVAADEDVVYLMARVKFLDPKAWIVALDTKNKTLRGAAEFGTEREPDARVLCCPSTISKYICDESGCCCPRCLKTSNSGGM